MLSRIFFSALLIPASLFCQTVRFSTNVGDIDVELTPNTTPLTVANFMSYVNRGAYTNSVIHRSAVTTDNKPFVIQGGGYRVENSQVVGIPADGPVLNEFNISNTRGTIAMAKVDGNPNSATNQWFFNVGDNSGNLDNQNRGFTVFGRISNAAGLAVLDKIAALPRVTNDANYLDYPLLSGTTWNVSNLVIVKSIARVSQPAISDNGVISAANFGGFNYAAPGSYLEIYGANLAGSNSRSWATSDFVFENAPTMIDQVSVMVGGKRAFVSYVSSGQVNVQIPADVSVGDAVPVVVSYRGAASPAANISIRSAAPGLLAPASFKVNDKQYVVGVRADGSLVSVDNPVKPGETLTFFGIGFGPVVGGTFAGKIVSAPASLVNPVRFKIGGFEAQVLYGGLAPGLVGLYQFNVVVPSNTEVGDVAVEVSQREEAVPQQLFLRLVRP